MELYLTARGVTCHNDSLSSKEGLVISCVLPTQGLVSSGGPTATLGPMFHGRQPKAVEQPSSWS